VLPRQLDDPSSPANAYVHGIAASQTGDMWLVGSGGTLDRLDPETGNIQHVLADVGTGYMPMGVHEDAAGSVLDQLLPGPRPPRSGDRCDQALGSAQMPSTRPLRSERAWFAEDCRRHVVDRLGSRRRATAGCRGPGRRHDPGRRPSGPGGRQQRPPDRPPVRMAPSGSQDRRGGVCSGTPDTIDWSRYRVRRTRWSTRTGSAMTSPSGSHASVALETLSLAGRISRLAGTLRPRAGPAGTRSQRHGHRWRRTWSG
jgi:hypothetical protein